MIFSAKIGKYRHRIEIQQKVESQGSSGEPIHTWQTVSGLESVPAEILSGLGKESESSSVKRGQKSARISFRWTDGITEEMRIIHNNIAYDIAAIDYDATGRREIRLSCISGLTDGS